MSNYLIDQRLNELIPESDELSNAMRYALLGPGKRLRPLLVLAAAKTLGARLESSLDPACALEMIHAYSLIHDDLPCMDNDDIRRGRPALHRVYPEGIALLAGDALQTEAFSTIACSPLLDQSTIGALIATLAQRAGRLGMAGGQAIDLMAAHSSLPPDRLIDMHIKKTGDLLSCCLEFGALIAKASSEQVNFMRELGQHLGLAYQIRDDLEDALQEQGQGADKGKPTSLSILGILGARHFLDQSLKKLEEGLLLLPNKASEIRHLIAPLFAPK